MREIYQRSLSQSRAQRESSRLGLARRETGAERGGRRHRQRPRKCTAKTAGLEGEGEVGEGKPVSWNSLGGRGEKSQEASVGSKRCDAVEPGDQHTLGMLTVTTKAICPSCQ